MAERLPPQANLRLVRFWLLFWPMLIVGGLAVALFGVVYYLVLLGWLFLGGAAIFETIAITWGLNGAQYGLVPFVGAAVFAGQFSSGQVTSAAAANLIGVVSGTIFWLLSGGLVVHAVQTVVSALVVCHAIRLVGVLFAGRWVKANGTERHNSDV